MAREIKFADCSATVAYADANWQLNEGEPWYADDPLVVDRPELFTDEPKRVRGTVALPAVGKPALSDAAQRKPRQTRG